MNIAKIVRITPDGKEFTTAHGTFYPFQVGFDDQRSGQCNSKSNPPPYKVGEIVGYDVTGQTPRGADKFKITRNPDASSGTYRPPGPMDSGNPDLEAARMDQWPKAQPAPNAAIQARTVAQTGPGIGSINGQTVGMSIGRAVEIWCATEATQGTVWGEQSAKTIHAIASDLIRASQSLEKGELSDSVPF